MASSSSSSSLLPPPSATFSNDNDVDRKMNEENDSMYRKYQYYPEYCSTPSQMKDRMIPPLNLQKFLPAGGERGRRRRRGQEQPEDVEHQLQNSESQSQIQVQGQLQLVHATVIIRHGARTPWSGPQNLKCWKDFWSSRQTGVWDCDDTLTTIMEPPSRTSGPTSAISHNKNSKNIAFRKLYDSLQFPNQGLVNELNGTCQLGQLLLQGYHQQLYNGRILRQAYGYGYEDGDDPSSSSSSTSSSTSTNTSSSSYPSSMNLIDLNVQPVAGDSDASLPWDKYNLHWRSDDDQRTVMSGQVLLQGLFGPELQRQYQPEHSGDGDKRKNSMIKVHLADRSKDILDANPGDCPRLREIKQGALLGERYQQFNTSQETAEVRRFLEEQLGVNVSTYNPIDDDDDILDCLMTTICTDRPLHPSVDDYDGIDDDIDSPGNGIKNNSPSSSEKLSWFTRVAHHDIQQYTIPMLWNDSEFAKLSLGPLWYEIMLNINPYAVSNADGVASANGAPKLALFSGHDTTIMPLLASLGPKLWNETAWAPYASMMNIEIYHINDDDDVGDDHGNSNGNGLSLASLFPSKVAFRLLYNGKVLTHLVDGCESQSATGSSPDPNETSEICDIAHFKSRIDPIATRDPSVCASAIPTTRDNLIDLSTTSGVMIYIGSVLTSFLLGILIPCCFARKRRQTRKVGRAMQRKAGYHPTQQTGEYDSGSFDGSDDDGDLEINEFQDEPSYGLR